MINWLLEHKARISLFITLIPMSIGLFINNMHLVLASLPWFLVIMVFAIDEGVGD